MSQDASTIRLTIDEINVDRDGLRIATLIDPSGDVVTIPLGLLPPGAQVNHVVLASFQLDLATSQDRARRVRGLQHRLFNRDTES